MSRRLNILILFFIVLLSCTKLFAMEGKSVSPIKILQEWIEEEKKFGAPNPQQAVLSTASSEGTPHARVVAIREITDNGLLFFTQLGTKKVIELQTSKKSAITFWFELLQRQVQIEGDVEELSNVDNVHYWENYPFEAQVRFCSYAPTSGQPILDKKLLENKKKIIQKTYRDKKLPMSSFYKGFRVKPRKIIFYSYRTDEFSDVFGYFNINGSWVYSILSP